MTEEIIDVQAEEIIEINEEDNSVSVKPRINPAEMRKLIKRYNRIKKSFLYEVGRIDGAYK
jgi:hypothetical protein